MFAIFAKSQKINGREILMDANFVYICYIRVLYKIAKLNGRENSLITRHFLDAKLKGFTLLRFYLSLPDYKSSYFTCRIKRCLINLCTGSYLYWYTKMSVSVRALPIIAICRKCITKELFWCCNLTVMHWSVGKVRLTKFVMTSCVFDSMKF